MLDSIVIYIHVNMQIDVDSLLRLTKKLPAFAVVTFPSFHHVVKVSEFLFSTFTLNP